MLLTNKFIGIGSAVDRNAAYFEQDIENAARYGYGVTVNIGFSDATTGATSRTTTISYTYLDQVLALLNTNRVVAMWNMGEGPPTHSTWRALNSGNTWPSTNRPPTGLHATLKSHWELIVARIRSKRQAAGLDPLEYDCFRIWGEGGKGGALDGRDSGSSPATYSSPWSGYAMGTWDAELHTMLGTLSDIDWQDHIVIGPALECEDATSSALGAIVTQEVATYGDGEDWRTNISTASDGQLIVTLDIYPDISSTNRPSVETAVSEFEGKLNRVMAAIMAQNWCPSDVLFHIGEHGWRASTVGHSNPFEMARYRLACEEVALANERIWGFSHYIMRDDNWGLFKADGTQTTGAEAFEPDAAPNLHLRLGLYRSKGVRRFKRR